MSAKETYTHDYCRVECPYCGELNDMSELVGQHGESLTEYECGNCCKPFDVQVHISISVTAAARALSAGDENKEP